jgi:hypothetical protein
MSLEYKFRALPLGPPDWLHNENASERLSEYYYYLGISLKSLTNVIRDWPVTLLRSELRTLIGDIKHLMIRVKNIS